MRNGKRCGPCTGGSPSPYGKGGAAPYNRWRRGITRVVVRMLMDAGIFATDLLLAARAWATHETDELPDDERVRAALKDHPRPFLSLPMIDAIIAREIRAYNRASAYMEAHKERCETLAATYRARGEEPPYGYNFLDHAALNRFVREGEESAPRRIRIAQPVRIASAATGLRFETDDDVLAALAEADDDTAARARPTLTR
jgi:hypothetical protein